ncbi:MAG: hypothetical protein ACRYGG_06695, partial [Janthinobacterium lividum]
NIVLLDAGTNDINRSPEVDPDNAPQRLSDLVVAARKACPDAVILVSTIGPSGNEGTQLNFNKFNQGILHLDNFGGGGPQVRIVNISGILAPSDLSDGLLPSSEGYVKMGNTWANAVSQALAAGVVVEPVHVAPPAEKPLPGGQCAVADLIWIPLGLEAYRIGSQDTSYHAGWLVTSEVSLLAEKPQSSTQRAIAEHVLILYLIQEPNWRDCSRSWQRYCCSLL